LTDEFPCLKSDVIKKKIALSSQRKWKPKAYTMSSQRIAVAINENIEWI